MRKCLAVFCSLAAASGVVAAPVSVGQAKTAVGNWLREDLALGCRLGASVDSARTCAPTNGARFHVVKLAGGGFVVTSADTKIEPVIAFSDSADLVESDGNPLWVLLKKDLSARAEAVSTGNGPAPQSVAPTVTKPTAEEEKWTKLLTGGTKLQGAGVSSVSDVRVAPLIQSKWGQKNNSIYSNWGDVCYNYYTPNNYPCGCVATVLAQLMRYHRYPASAAAVSRKCAVDGTQSNYTMKGGSYDYANMPSVPEADSCVSWYAGGATAVQREAIGKLTYDCGVAMQMAWKSGETGGSGAGGGAAHGPLKTVFNYANAHTVANGLGDATYRTRIICPNLDAGYPVMLGVDGSYGGHEILADGYGYSGNVLYTHLNMGWDGTDDAWYALPSGSGSQYAFSSVSHAIYNVFPDKTGEIVSGRVVTAGGAPVAGATVMIKQGSSTVASKTTDAHGIFAFVVASGKTYTVIASHLGSEAQTSAAVTASADSSVTLNVGNYSYNPNASAPNCGNVMCGDLVLSNLATVSAPQFSPDSCLFYPSTNVTISCATAGAVIHYTTDGTDPTESSPVYSNAIRVEDDMKIKARAYKTGANPSVIASAAYTYDTAQGAPKGDYFSNPIQISGNTGSYSVADNSGFTVEVDEPCHTKYLSGNTWYLPNQYRTVWFRWTAPGTGTMTFTLNNRSVSGYQWWAVPIYITVYRNESWDYSNRVNYSNSSANGSDRDTEVQVSFSATQGETYRLVGMYGSSGNFPGRYLLSWNGNLVVTQTATSTTEVPVPYAWLDARFTGSHTAQQYEALALADQDGDGFPTWQEYVLDTDPNDATSTFTVSIRMNGSTPVIELSHTNPNIDALGFRYVTKGRASLTSGAWSDFDPAVHYFIKVVVEEK